MSGRHNLYSPVTSKYILALQTLISIQPQPTSLLVTCFSLTQKVSSLQLWLLRGSGNGFAFTDKSFGSGPLIRLDRCEPSIDDSLRASFCEDISGFESRVNGSFKSVGRTGSLSRGWFPEGKSGSRRLI